MIDQARFALLLVHALAGTVGLLTGVYALLGRPHPPVTAHLVAQIVMTVTLIPSLALGWHRFPPVTRVIFVALTVLGVVMTLVALRAQRSRRPDGAGLSVGQVDLVGFNVISLSVAGTIVPTINLAGNPVAVTVTVVGSLVLARWFVQRQRRSAVSACGS